MASNRFIESKFKLAFYLGFSKIVVGLDPVTETCSVN